MAVIRINKTADYTVMSNTHFKEKEMSLKAKGLLSMMLSLPDDWDYSIAGLVTLSKDGKDSVMNALTELEQFGYLKRTRTTNEKGQFAGYDYDIYERPQQVQPKQEQPYAENPNTDNPPQLNTNQSSNKKLNTKVLNNIADYRAEFEKLWTLYPNKKGKDKAQQAYIKARKAGVTFETVEKGIKAYAEECRLKNREKQYIKHCSTWFNGNGWNDEYDLTANTKTNNKNNGWCFNSNEDDDLDFIK